MHFKFHFIVYKVFCNIENECHEIFKNNLLSFITDNKRYNKVSLSKQRMSKWRHHKIMKLLQLSILQRI